jgi:hypothetical protein
MAARCDSVAAGMVKVQHGEAAASLGSDITTRVPRHVQKQHNHSVKQQSGIVTFKLLHPAKKE